MLWTAEARAQGWNRHDAADLTLLRNVRIPFSFGRRPPSASFNNKGPQAAPIYLIA
jgi:hypothetical protein